MSKKFKVPSWASIGLGAVAGILGGLNVATFGLAQPWSELVTFACAAGASLGVAPLTHGALRNALHLTYPSALAFAGMLATATAGVTAAKLDGTLKGILVGVLTAAAGVLAGPDAALAPVPVPVPASPPEPAQKATRVTKKK